ncbi:hypothetical protein [Rhizobium sp. SL86]|uniref:hypothetical protein n=1 Tax=Rhizobium sp. SL86 TaxID=2995148 RepID=UPI002274C336|nr:hypothetical protein [Rhizobium sp. SL86]MCY1667693.1 hypothetical protein [Rhizobium sp. SL86]
MSSTPLQEHLDPFDFAMIRDVLRAGGFRGVEATANSDAKKAASVFLKTEFCNGKRTRETLLLALQSKRVDLHKGLPVAISRKSEAIDRWQDEGGQ